MGLNDFVRGELVEIIEWTDAPRDTITFRFPDDDRAIKRGAQLVVRPSQAAQFIYLGEFGDTFTPGTYSLTTANMPVLTRLRSWRYGFESPFKADVFFVATRAFTGNPWGTSNPIMTRDKDFGVVRLRAFGTYDFAVVDPRRFLEQVAGTDNQFELDEFAGTMRSRIVGAFSGALAASGLPILEIAARYRELGDALLPLVNQAFEDKYGVRLSSFVVENVSAPPEVEEALDKRSAMSAIGNMSDFVKYQMGQRLEHDGTGGIAGLGAELAAGMTLAKDLTAGAPQNDVLTPADAARLLKLTEADVVASLESGDLKGKKIGDQWRLTKAAVDAFLR